MNRASEDGRVAGKPIWVARYEWIERMQPFVTDPRVPPEVQEKLRADIDRLRAMADEDRDRETKLQESRGAPDPS